MSLSVRIFIAYFLLVGLAGWWFLRGFVAELAPGMRQSLEEVLVETANLLAERVATEMAEGRENLQVFDAELQRLSNRHFNAAIWSLIKNQSNLIVYITDIKGRVIYHSQYRDLGADYSRWHDVYLTLHGKYGARTTRTDEADPNTSVMYIAAPLRVDGKLVGVLSLGKPSIAVQPFIETAERNLRQQGLWLLIASFAIGAIFAVWLTRSIRRLTQYAKAVSTGMRIAPPKIAEKELATLGNAMAIMRQELEGKEYVERYLHTLTHELRSPLTAIRGAAELLLEDMPAAARQRFLTNIHKESERLQQIVERLLNLAALEKRHGLEQVTSIDTLILLQEIIESKQLIATNRHIKLRLKCSSADIIRGERFLLQQAISNLLDNALDFSPINSAIDITAYSKDNVWHLVIRDYGPGIPDYAATRIFERFYSQPRPDTGCKSTGLGLSLVYEVAQLHGGSIVITNAIDGGTNAVLLIPIGYG